MNEYDRLYRLTQRYEKTYPPGTRLELIDMNDVLSRIRDNTSYQEL